MFKKITATFLTAVLSLPLSFGVISPLVTPAVAAGLHYSPTLSVDKNQAQVGETLTYTYNVVNDGDGNLTSVTMHSRLSDFVTLKSGSTNIYKGPNTVTGFTDNWVRDGLNLGGLKPGQSAKVTFQAVVKSNVAAGSTIQTSIRTTTVELPTEVPCAAYTTVGGTFKYQPSKTVDKATATRGETLTYTLKATNTGDLTLHDVSVAETLPGKVTYIAGSTVSTKGSSTVNVTDAWIADGVNLGELTPGQSATVVFKVKVNANANNGDILENVGHFTAKELPNEIQCAAITKVVVEQKEAKGFLKIFKYNDYDGDGVFDGVDKGVGGFTFHIVGANYDQTVTVDASGVWNSGQINAGEYTITEEDKSGWTHTTSKSVTVKVTDAQTTEVRFGNKEAGKVLPTELPNTGPALALFGLLGAGPAGYLLRRLRKKI